MTNTLSNVQLELLKTFSRNVSDEDVKEIKRLLTHYFAQKAIAGANQKWDEESWTPEKVDELLHTHLRTPYTSKK